MHWLDWVRIEVRVGCFFFSFCLFGTGIERSDDCLNQALCQTRHPGTIPARSLDLFTTETTHKTQ